MPPLTALTSATNSARIKGFSLLSIDPAKPAGVQSFKTRQTRVHASCRSSAVLLIRLSLLARYSPAHLDTLVKQLRVFELKLQQHRAKAFDMCSFMCLVNFTISSCEFKMVSMRSKKPIIYIYMRSTPSLRSFPNVAFETFQSSPD